MGSGGGAGSGDSYDPNSYYFGALSLSPLKLPEMRACDVTVPTGVSDLKAHTCFVSTVLSERPPSFPTPAPGEGRPAQQHPRGTDGACPQGRSASGATEPRTAGVRGQDRTRGDPGATERREDGHRAPLLVEGRGQGVRGQQAPATSPPGPGAGALGLSFLWSVGPDHHTAAPSLGPLKRRTY